MHYTGLCTFKIYKMKTIISSCLFYFPIILFAQKANSTSGIFELEGRLTGKDTGNIYLAYYDAVEGYIKKSSSLKNGNFDFKGTLSSPCMATLYLNKNYQSVDDSNVAEFFIEPGKIKLKASYNALKKAIVTGSPTQVDYEQYLIQTDMLNQKADSIYKALNKLYTDEKNLKIKDTILENELLAERKKIRLEQTQSDLKYILKYPQSFISAYLLMYKINNLSVDTIQKYYDRLNPAVQHSVNGKVIHTYLLQQAGTKAPNFEGYDIISGKKITLHQYKNKKIVLLDFWASYCTPCRELTPYFKNLYQQYHKAGLEIIGISNDDKRKDAWRKVITDDNLYQWPQILQQVGTKNDIGNLYGVSAIPCIFIIDKDGKIALRMEGNDEKEKIGVILKKMISE